MDPPKLLWGQAQKYPPPPCGKKDPPHKKNSPHVRGENVYTFCTHRNKCPHRGKEAPHAFFI